MGGRFSPTVGVTLSFYSADDLMTDYLQPVLTNPALFRQHVFVAGRWADADDGRTLDVCNPADGSAIGRVPNVGAVETRRAIDAANRAMPDWRARTAKERAQILRRWFD